MEMTEEQRKEMTALAAKLVSQLPAKSAERAWAALIANGQMPYHEVARHFRRICVHVRDSKSPRFSRPVRAEVLEWLAHHGGHMSKDPEDIRGARRLEMRLTTQEYEEIQQRATKAGLSMADYCRWLIFRPGRAS